MNDWIKLSAPLKKIGNSYSVRIPMNLVNRMNAEEGHVIYMKIKRMKLALTPEVMDFWFGIARRCNELDKFSDDQIFLFSRLAFNEGKYILESTGEKFDKVTEDMMDAHRDYRKKIKKEFGEQVVEDFEYFRVVIDPVMQEMNEN